MKFLTSCLKFFNLYEQRCLACRQIFQSSTLPLCPTCTAQLRPYNPQKHCSKCGELSALGSLLCSACQQNPPPWQEFKFYGNYNNILRQLLLRGKFKADLPALHFLGSLIPTDFQPLDAIVPIPLHPKRLLERGFNQSYELALPLASKLQIPIQTNLLTRYLNTKQQASLSRTARLTNLTDAFTSENTLVQHKNILLIDDICTTGSTLRHCALTLLQAGAASIHVAVVAKTILPQAGRHVL